VRNRTIALAAPMLLSTAAFNASFAESPVVSEQGFDWIFFAIVGIPFVLALFDTLKNDGKRPGATEGIVRRYPPTVSNDLAAEPLTAWRTHGDEEVLGEPQPNTRNQ
jgi:hypothetical protein